MREEIRVKIEQISQQVIEPLGYDLVEVQFKPGKRSLVRVFIDRLGGVDLDDCERVSRVLGDSLDAEDPIPGRYTLEVSSPGLDRPLKTGRDFARKVGQPCQITWQPPDTAAPLEQVTGQILRADPDRLAVRTETGDLEITIGSVVRAKLVY